MQDLTESCVRDLGPELASLGVQGLREGFCVRCFNPQCTLSRTKASWEQRIATQPERFFNPLQADPTSSRYEGVLKAAWEAVQPRGWVSLNSSTVGRPVTISPGESPVPAQGSRRNTSVPEGGVMIGGPAPAEPQRTVVDPWAIPAQTIKPGARITLGSDKSGS